MSPQTHAGSDASTPPEPKKDLKDLFNFEPKEAFYILGPNAGYTATRVKRMIEAHGGLVTSNEANPHLKRVILSPSFWAKHSQPMAISRKLKAVMKANRANEIGDDGEPKDDESFDEYRNWLLPLEWLLDSVEAGVVLDEMDYDFEKQEDLARNERAAQLREERRRNGGKSRFGSRAERREAELNAEIRREERKRKQEEQEEEMRKISPTRPKWAPRVAPQVGLQVLPQVVPQVVPEVVVPAVVAPQTFKSMSDIVVPPPVDLNFDVEHLIKACAGGSNASYASSSSTSATNPLSRGSELSADQAIRQGASPLSQGGRGRANKLSTRGNKHASRGVWSDSLPSSSTPSSSGSHATPSTSTASSSLASTPVTWDGSSSLHSLAPSVSTFATNSSPRRTTPSTTQVSRRGAFSVPRRGRGSSSLLPSRPKILASRGVSSGSVPSSSTPSSSGSPATPSTSAASSAASSSRFDFPKILKRFRGSINRQAVDTSRNSAVVSSPGKKSAPSTSSDVIIPSDDESTHEAPAAKKSKPEYLVLD